MQIAETETVYIVSNVNIINSCCCCCCDNSGSSKRIHSLSDTKSILINPVLRYKYKVFSFISIH
jgi:hypothetical protein